MATRRFRKKGTRRKKNIKRGGRGLPCGNCRYCGGQCWCGVDKYGGERLRLCEECQRGYIEKNGDITWVQNSGNFWDTLRGTEFKKIAPPPPPPSDEPNPYEDVEYLQDDYLWENMWNH